MPDALTYRPDRQPLVAPGAAEIHAADMTATFSAEIKLDSLNLGDDLWLPIDGDDDQPVGLPVERNSTGPLRLGYGGWRDLLLGCQYRDGHDRLITVGGRTMKNVAGYDLTKFMIGQRGIFGRLVTITTRLHRRPSDAYLAEFNPDIATFNSLMLSDCRPQWAMLTPQRLFCGYHGNASTVEYYQHQIQRFRPVRWRRQSFEIDQSFRRLHWRAAGEWKLSASIPPARILDFTAAAGLSQWVADPAFGIVLASVDHDSLDALRAAALAAGGSAWFDGPAGLLDWSPPPGQRDILQRLKRTLDPDHRLAPLPWKADSDVNAPSPG